MAFRLLRTRRRISIDAAGFTDKEAAHKILANALLTENEPYGANLDALHDVLTSIGTDVTLKIRNFSAAQNYLGDYATTMRSVFADSARDNPHLKVTVID